MLTFMWWYLVLQLVRHPGEEPRVALHFTLRSLVTTCTFVVSIPVAYVVIGRVVHARVPRKLRLSI